jgi:FAD/FMN-containing dehydrogenase
MTTPRTWAPIGLAFVALAACWAQAPPVRPEFELNDVHSKLNATLHAGILYPASVSDIQAAVRAAKASGQAISISGGRHAMGGQQFGAGTLNLSMSGFKEVVAFDAERGIVEVQSGIQWPDLVAWLLAKQAGAKAQWGIRQKQTGADRLSIGGALASNIHGRGLDMRPMIDDVESFTLVDVAGDLQTCSRTEHPDLFRLVIGGYGLFGVIANVRVRLAPVRILERVVRVVDVDQFLPLVAAWLKEGCLYGDFQFAIDPQSDKFMKTGICAAISSPITAGPGRTRC